MGAYLKRRRKGGREGPFTLLSNWVVVEKKIPIRSRGSKRRLLLFSRSILLECTRFTKGKWKVVGRKEFFLSAIRINGVLRSSPD